MTKTQPNQKLKGTQMRDERDLGIQHDGTENPGIVHGGSKIIDRLLVVRVRTVREVESCNVHSRPQKLFQHRHRPRRRPQSADNLRLRPLLLHLNSSLTAERSRRVYLFFFFYDGERFYLLRCIYKAGGPSFIVQSLLVYY